jgi:outer membrane receptor protein involved in Fe transport
MRHAHRAIARALLLLTVVALASLPLAAQTVTGTMRGSVTDRSGAALPGVTVTIRNVDTGLERVIVTGSDGSFSAPFLQIGRYNVQAELSGFGTMKHNNVRVELNETVVQEFILNPATMTETVTVSADAPRVDVTDGEIKQTMGSKEIMSLPAPDQSNFLRLASTFGGYMENPTSGQDNPTASSGSSVNFNGAGTRGTTFQINGVNNDDSSENQHRQLVPLATIQSFQVLTNNFSAEFGRGYGAVVLVQTKSGTNSLDGELYAYGTDNAHKTRDILTVSLNHGDQHRYQYGGTAGFPLIRDRLFGYVNADKVDLAGTGTATRGLFTAADLALPRLTLGNDTPANREWQNSILARWQTGTTPNAPNIASRAYQYLQDVNFPDRDTSGRLDFNMTANNTFTGRYQRSHQIRATSEVILGENALQNNRQSNFGLTWTGILSSNTVQEGRIGVGLRSTNVDIGTGNDTPIVRFNSTGVPTFTILGNSGAFPIHRNQRDDQLVYNISSAHFTRHTLKGGIDFRKSQLNDIADNFSRGFWTFATACGGTSYPTSIAAFMAGCVQRYERGYGPFDLKNSIREYNGYVQDDWRPFDNLTLNLGARYERVGVPKEDDNKINYFYKDSSYVDPRLGFAYTPDWSSHRFLRAITGSNGQFSIRGGFGVFHGRVFQSIFSQNGANVRFNLPNALDLVINDRTNLADPTEGFVFVPGQLPSSRITVTQTFIDPNLKMPETRQWNLTFERQIFWQSRLRLSYVGTLGKDLLQYDRDNLPLSPDDPNSKYKVAADWRCAGTGFNGILTTATCPTAVPIADNEISLRVPRTNERRPDARYGTNLIVRNQAQSWYHAGQLEWESGEYHGLNTRLTYTFSKALDTGSEATFVGTGDTNILIDNPNFKRGLSRFDTRHRFTWIASYQLPWLLNRNDILGAALGGWQLSTVVRLASGTPFTIIDGGSVDANFDGVADGRPVCVDKNYCGGWHITNPADKSQMPAGAFRHSVYGDKPEDLIARNSFYKDGNKSVDLGLYKSFHLPYSTTLMVRLDAFNIFNQVTWGFPVNDMNATNFGTVNTTAYSPRAVQLGFRLLY